MEVTADDTRLYGDYTDATRVVCRVTDRVSTTLVYFPGIIQVENQWPNPGNRPLSHSCKGGCAAFWVKTKPQSFSKC